MWLDLKPDCDRQRLAQQLENISPFMLLNLRQLRWVVDILLVVSRLGCRVRLWPAGGGVSERNNKSERSAQMQGDSVWLRNRMTTGKKLL